MRYNQDIDINVTWNFFNLCNYFFIYLFILPASMLCTLCQEKKEKERDDHPVRAKGIWKKLQKFIKILMGSI